MNKEKISKLKIGDEVLFSGIIYTARDQAHKKLIEAIKNKTKISLDLKGKIIYYCGPTKTPKGKAVGSCGPTTSSRMDGFTSELLRFGIAAIIGKGSRSDLTVKAIKENKAVYFLTYAGCGALLSKHVKKNKVVAYSDLGPEAIYELEVEDFPLIVGIDSKGRNIYGKK